MKRSSVPWLLAAPLMVAGSLSAHTLGYLAFASAPHPVGADADRGVEVVGRTTHGLLTQAPLLVGLLVAFMIVGFAHAIAMAGRGKTSRRAAPAWLFLLPPIAFLAQELAERLIHAEGFPFSPVHEPALLAALVLQVPFGLAAFLIARLLTRVADALGRALSTRRTSPSPARRAVIGRPLRTVGHRGTAGLVEGHSSRSPPLVVL